jgi:arylsulfatase A-like enzyme
MSSKNLFKYLCALWGLVFILIFLPCDFLFRFDSMVKFMESFDMVADLSIVIQAFALLIVLWAILNSAIHALIHRKVKSIIWMTNLSVAVALILFTFVNFGIKWILIVHDGKANKYIFANTVWGNIFFLLLVVLGFVSYNIISPKFLSIAPKLLQTLGIICLLSFFVICFRLIQTHYILPDTESIQVTRGSGAKPNVILITFDALCAEDMSLYGYSLGTTPYINKLARESFVFEHFYANSNWTRPSVASILTGSRPVTHGLTFVSCQNLFAKNEKGIKNLPMFLRLNGFDTLASTGNLLYAHPWRNDSFRGFVRKPYARAVDRFVNLQGITSNLLKIRSTAGTWFNETILLNVPFAQFIHLKQYSKVQRDLKENQIGILGEPAEFNFRQAENLLANCKMPFFLWVHLFPPHNPYLAPERFRHAFLTEKTLETWESQDDPQADWHKLRLRYDEMILYSDSTLNDFLSNIKKMGIYDNTMIIVSSDHGESFVHGYKGHGGPFLYQQLVHVPLIIHLPGQKKGFVVRSNAEQIDIAPTIVELLGMRDPGWFEGESLTKAMFEGYYSKKPKYTMNLEWSKMKEGGMSRSIAVVEGNYKYILYPDSKQSELYNLAVDPKEMHNLVQVDKNESRYLHSLIVRDVLSKLKN